MIVPDHTSGQAIARKVQAKNTQRLAERFVCLRTTVRSPKEDTRRQAL